jgi:integrase
LTIWFKQTKEDIMGRKRRGRGEGSIEELPSGKFRVVISAGKDPTTGRRLKITRTFDRKSEALDFRAEMLKLHRSGATPLGFTKKLIVNEWLDTWLAGKKSSREAGTVDFYEKIAKRHIRSTIGKTLLTELKPITARQWLQTLEAAGVSRDQQLKARDLLSSALNDAVEAEVIPRNPMKGGQKVPRPKPAQKEVQSWTADEARRFLTAAETGRYGTYYRLLSRDINHYGVRGHQLLRA